MANETVVNTPITVTTSIDETGHIRPKSLVWQGRTISIIGTGRQWKDKNGRHILVETANGDRFELQLSQKELLWYLKRAWQNNELAA